MSEEARKRNVGSAGAGGQSLAAKSVRSVGLNPGGATEGEGGEGFLAGVGKRWAEMDVRLRFTIIDSFLSFFIITPLVLVYWYGIYGLLDRLVDLVSIPEGMGPWAMLAGGIYVESLVCFLQRDLHQRLTSGSPNDLSHYLVTRLFNLFLSVANIAHYRALELLFQEHMNVNVRVAFQTAVTATVLLWSMKCGRNILGPPLFVEVDSEVSDVFQTSTRFKTSVSILCTCKHCYPCGIAKNFQQDDPSYSTSTDCGMCFQYKSLEVAFCSSIYRESVQT